MEPKKNPKYDIHRKRGLILQFSFALSVAMVILAFKWSVPVTETIGCKLPKLTDSDDMQYVPIVYSTPQKQQAPKPLKKSVITLPEFLCQHVHGE